MKTETEIAKENVRRNLSNDREDDEFTMNWLKQNKQSCERNITFMNKLERINKEVDEKTARLVYDFLNDNKGAIKVYEDGGIR